jgi:hypothetical protein
MKNGRIRLVESLDSPQELAQNLTAVLVLGTGISGACSLFLRSGTQCHHSNIHLRTEVESIFNPPWVCAD